MIRIEQAVIVEGKYDKIKLSGILDTLIIETDGFAVFKDKEKQRLIKRLADSRGIVIMTDSDSAGFLIRSFLGGSIPPEKVTHVYIPDIFGKEKRKPEASKEGKLGVEGMPAETILKALTRAGVICTGEGGDAPESGKRQITNLDLYSDGISGGAESKAKRARLLEIFALPSRLSTGALIKVLNTFVSFEEYKDAVRQINETEEHRCSK